MEIAFYKSSLYHALEIQQQITADMEYDGFNKSELLVEHLKEQLGMEFQQLCLK